MTRFIVSVVCSVLLLYELCDSSRILVVVPTPSLSHQIVFRPLTQELAKRGHNITVLTTDPAFEKGQTPPNLTDIDVHDVSYKIWRDMSLLMAKERGFKITKTRHMMAVLKIFPALFEAQMNNAEFQKVIYGTEKFDLVIVPTARIYFVFPYILQSPGIAIGTIGLVLDQFDTFVGPAHPLLYPDALHQRVYNLTLWEKIEESFSHFYSNYLYRSHEYLDNEAIRKVFGPNIPTVDELRKNLDMLFVNTHPIFEGNYPVSPDIIHVWGIHHKPEKELPQDLKQHMDSSKHGIIYMSFGSNVDPTMLPPEKIDLFVKVFSKLPYDVLWKWNGDKLPNKPDNVKIQKWFPQADLLRHSKVKLFITQGGLQSTDEAIIAKVPLVTVPMMGDQWFNAEKHVHLGIGVKLNWEMITEDQIKDAIETVINDESYRKNIERLSTLMQDEPLTGLERAVWWIEYVIRHGGAKHLRSPARNITWKQYFELELIFTVFLILFASIFTVITIVYFVFKFLRNKFVQSKKKTL